MVVSGGMYLYGIQVTVDVMKKLLNKGIIKGSNTDNMEDMSEEDILKFNYNDLEPAVEVDGIELWWTPHECRWTDVEGGEVYLCESHMVDFKYGKLPEFNFKHIPFIDELAADLNVETTYLFAPDDCNCCS